MTQRVSRRALLAALPATACAAAGEPNAVATSYAVVVFTRHAEKGANDPTDPDLSEAGAARAARLAELLATSGATRLLASDKKRTQQTLRPLGDRLDVQVTVLPAADEDAWIAALSTADQRVTIVASHSNVIPKLVTALGGRLARLDDRGNIPESEYGRLVVMTLSARPGEVDEASTLELMLP